MLLLLRSKALGEGLVEAIQVVCCGCAFPLRPVVFWGWKLLGYTPFPICSFPLVTLDVGLAGLTLDSYYSCLSSVLVILKRLCPDTRRTFYINLKSEFQIVQLKFRLWARQTCLFPLSSPNWKITGWSCLVTDFYVFSFCFKNYNSQHSQPRYLWCKVTKEVSFKIPSQNILSKAPKETELYFR